MKTRGLALGGMMFVLLVLPSCGQKPLDGERALKDLRSSDISTFERALDYYYKHPGDYSPQVGDVLIEIAKAAPDRASIDKIVRYDSSIDFLGWMKEKRAVPMLVERLKADPADGVVSLALAEIGDESAVEPLISIFDSRAESGTNCVDVALCGIGGARAVDFLLERLEKNPEEARVVRALGEIGDRRALEPLLRSQAKYGQGRLGEVYLTAIARIPDDRALPLLLDASHDPDKAKRSDAAEGLGRTGNPAGLARLKEMLGTEMDSTVRYCIFIGLGHNGTEEAVVMLDKELKSMTADDFSDMVAGRNPANGFQETDGLFRSLAATQRASGLVSLMDTLKALHEFGIRRYLDATQENKVDSACYVGSALNAIFAMTGDNSLYENRLFEDIRYNVSEREAARIFEDAVSRNLRWWEKNQDWVKKLAVDGKKLPRAKVPSSFLLK